MIGFIIAVNLWTVFGSAWLCSTWSSPLLCMFNQAKTLSSTGREVLAAASHRTLPESQYNLLRQCRTQRPYRLYTYLDANAVTEGFAIATEAENCRHRCLCCWLFVSSYIIPPTINHHVTALVTGSTWSFKSCRQDEEWWKGKEQNIMSREVGPMPHKHHLHLSPSSTS